MANRKLAPALALLLIPLGFVGGRSRVFAAVPSSLAAGPAVGEAVGILNKNCATCHSGATPMGSLRLTSRAEILKGGVSGPAVTLAQPEKSLLLQAINYHGRQMPPSGKLPQAQIDALARWVKQGLPWPAKESAAALPVHTGPPPVTPETMKFWSFQPVRPRRIPIPKRQAWVRNPIDAFVLQGLEAAGLTPNPPAGREALLRRACYDMTGLPPSPEAARAFSRIAPRTPGRRWWTGCLRRRNMERNGAGTGWTWSISRRRTATSGTGRSRTRGATGIT